MLGVDLLGWREMGCVASKPPPPRGHGNAKGDASSTSARVPGSTPTAGAGGQASHAGRPNTSSYADLVSPTNGRRPEAEHSDAVGSARGSGGASTRGAGAVPFHGGVPAPFAYVTDGKSSSVGRRSENLVGSVGGARGSRGLSAAELEINRLRAAVKDAEARVEEERLVFSVMMEEERVGARRLREHVEMLEQELGRQWAPQVMHSTHGAILDRKYNPGGVPIPGRGGRVVANGRSGTTGKCGVVPNGVMGKGSSSPDRPIKQSGTGMDSPGRVLRFTAAEEAMDTSPAMPSPLQAGLDPVNGRHALPALRQPSHHTDSSSPRGKTTSSVDQKRKKVVDGNGESAKLITKTEVPGTGVPASSSGAVSGIGAGVSGAVDVKGVQVTIMDAARSPDRLPRPTLGAMPTPPRPPLSPVPPKGPSTAGRDGANDRDREPVGRSPSHTTRSLRRQLNSPPNVEETRPSVGAVEKTLNGDVTHWSQNTLYKQGDSKIRFTETSMDPVLTDDVVV